MPADSSSYLSDVSPYVEVAKSLSASSRFVADMSKGIRHNQSPYGIFKYC